MHSTANSRRPNREATDGRADATAERELQSYIPAQDAELRALNWHCVGQKQN
jgi:hypothetical protein